MIYLEKHIATFTVSVYKIAITVAILFGLSLHSANAAPSKSHSHNGRVHTHILPATGVKHYHKHQHNGRSHIHPYSAKLGFKHSHTKNNPRAKAWANAKKHNHYGRVHSHPLPRSGIKHQHRHKHGGRSHIHPLPVSGLKHYHQLNKRTAKVTQNIASVKPVTKTAVKIAEPRIIRGLSIKQQIDAVLNTPLKDIPKASKAVVKQPRKINLNDKKTVALVNNRKATSNQAKRKTPVLNSKTINKVLRYGYHQHDGRTHQHPLPNTGVKHSHQHAHAGRVHLHPIPPSKTAHTHNSNKNVKPQLAKNNQIRTVENANKNNTQKTSQRINQQRIAKQKTAQQLALQKRIKLQNLSRARAKQAAIHQQRQQNKLRQQARQQARQKAIKAEPAPRVVVKPFKKPQKQTSQQITESNRQFQLAIRYENGTGVKRDLDQAINWYLKAAKQGHSKAQFNLASLYENGEGSIQNTQKAIRWYTTAAHNGDANAQVNLGNQYAHGINLPKNINEAAKWYKRAADQGSMRGRANLNYLIDGNNGVTKK